MVTTADAMVCGVPRRELTDLVRAGALVRVRGGAYVDGPLWRGADRSERHALSAVAVGRAFGGRWAVSHCSAIAVHGLPLLSVGEEVHLSRLAPGPTRSRSGIVTHAALDASVVSNVRGVLCATPSVAVVQTAASQGLEAGVVSADAAIRRRLATISSLRDAVGQARLGRGQRWARMVPELADGRSESPGESRTRVLLHLGGLSGAEPQVVIWDGRGRFVARVDLLFRRQRVVVEFDGLVKYDRATGRAALIAEKRREDALRALGYEVVRVTWADLADPARVLAQVRAAFDRADRAGSR